MKNTITTSQAWSMLLDSDIRDTLRHLRDLGDAFGIAMLRRAEGCTIGEIASEFRHNTAGVHLLTRGEWQGLAVMTAEQAQEACLRQPMLREVSYDRLDPQITDDLIECCASNLRDDVTEREVFEFLADAWGPLGVSPRELEFAVYHFLLWCEESREVKA